MPQDIPSFSQVSKYDIGFGLEGQEVATSNNLPAAGTDENGEKTDRLDQVDQLNQSPSKYTLPPENLNSADGSQPKGTSVEQNLLGADNTINKDGSPVSSTPSPLDDQGQKEAWIIEPGNGQDAETHQNDLSPTKDRLFPPPTCLNWVIGCCDSYWLGEWKLGCSTCIFLTSTARWCSQYTSLIISLSQTSSIRDLKNVKKKTTFSAVKD